MLGSNPQPPTEVRRRRRRLQASTPIPTDNKRMMLILIEFKVNNGQKCIPHSTKQASSGTKEQIQDIIASDRGDKSCVCCTHAKFLLTVLCYGRHHDSHVTTDAGSLFRCREGFTNHDDEGCPRVRQSAVVAAAVAG